MRKSEKFDQDVLLFTQETQEQIIDSSFIEEKDTLFLNQDEEKPTKSKKIKLPFLNHSLLLKQTLISAWKTKLQLVILLLLTAFSTSLVTGSWISYQRVKEGEIFLELDKTNFDAVAPAKNGIQIANQAFSLRFGRLYYQASGTTQAKSAIYFDNSIIGKEINKLNSSDLNIVYQRNNFGIIDGITDFEWSNPEKPLTFNRGNPYVKASVYGQLLAKADKTNNLALKNYYNNAAQELYNNLFVKISAKQILDSLQTYFIQWIKVNSNDYELLSNSDNYFTNFLINKKINYQSGDDQKDINDNRIPDSVNVAKDIDDFNGVLATKLLKKDELKNNPRLSSSTSPDYGMNGQWMTIYRDFDITPENSTEKVISDFSQNYHSKYSFNNINDIDDTHDENEPNTYSYYSYHFAQAAANLQNRNINVINEFIGPAGIDKITGQSTNVKIIDLGVKENHSSVNLKIFEGLYPSNKNEIVISPQYARQKGIKPGNSININNKTFMISGIGGDAYNIYPTLNSLDPVPNTRTEFLAYVLPEAFYSKHWFSPNDITRVDLMYFLPWENVKVDDFDISYFDDYFQVSLFKNNKLNDRNQYDYSQYLIEKYNKNNSNYQSKYQIDSNLIVTKDNNQFSTYNKGRKVLDATLNGFKYVAIISVIFLVLIVIFITYLIIKKAIKKDQISMGILKSTGYSTRKIVISYISYPILVTLLAVPLGWLIGLVFQIYFTELFNTMFILPYNVFSFSIIPLFIALALVGGFVLITTLVSAYRLLQKQALELIQTNIDISIANSNFHQNSKLTSKLNFKGRFLLSLSKTNWKKIAVTALVISVATLAITATVSIPATISGMKDNYFKTQKYKNYYQYQNPIPNMPLSKYGLYAWDNLNNRNNNNYYPVAGTMPWPDNIIINDNAGKPLAWYNPLDYEGNKSNNNFESIVKFIANIDVNDQNILKEEIGNYLSSLTNGPLDLNLIAWNYSWLGGRGFSNAMIKDLTRIDKSHDKNFSTSVVNFVSTLLPGILNVTNPGVPPGLDALPEILKQILPGFIRQILDRQGPNAYDYFSISHNTVAYNPLYNSEINGPEEELLTQLQLGSIDSNLINAGFLDISGINPNTKMLVMNSGLVQDLKYDSSASVIPIVINKSFAAKYNLSVGQTINAAPNVRTLYYRNNQGILKPLPKNNWYYGSNPLNQSTDSKALWSSNANRWNYRGQKSIPDTEYTNSYGYNYDGFYDNDGNQEIKDVPDSWNDVNQVWLKLPEDIDLNAKSGNLRTADSFGSLSFNIKNIAASNPDVNGYTWIKPFSFEVADDYKGTELNPVNLLTTKIPEWYGAMLDKGIFVADDSLHISSLKSEFTTKFPEWWKDIVGKSNPITKYRIIGVQNSYDNPRAYVDQKWANLISGYSYYDNRTEQKDPVYNNGIYQWFSGKLSAADNIYDLISRMSFKRHADDYTMYSMTSLSGNGQELLIPNSDLLIKKQEMLNKMADIAALATALFIVMTIICSILIIIMITDVFLEQFQRFMSQMKAEGYSNTEINAFTLGIFTPWVLLGYGVGYGLGYLIIFAFIKVIASLTGLALPFVFIWWIIPISFIIIVLIYFSTYIINTVHLNKMNLITLLQTN